MILRTDPINKPRCLRVYLSSYHTYRVSCRAVSCVVLCCVPVLLTGWCSSGFLSNLYYRRHLISYFGGGATTCVLAPCVVYVDTPRSLFLQPRGASSRARANQVPHASVAARCRVRGQPLHLGQLCPDEGETSFSCDSWRHSLIRLSKAYSGGQ